MASHAEVAANFARRKINRLTGDVTWKGKNVSCQGNTIYSYGWWPMAHYLGEQDDKHVFLVRADRYSATTSGHQGSVLYHCHGPTVSFDALRAAGVDADCIGLEHIIDYESETRIYLDRKDGQYFQDQEPYTVPNQGMFVTQKQFEDGSVRGYWHVLGGVVIECGPSRYLLCGLDENTYFVSELPSKPISVVDAYDILKPPEVKQAEAHGISVLRQGEWFFIPTDLTDRDITDMLGFKYLKEMRSRAETGPLPTYTHGTNQHVCKHVDTYAADHRTGQLVGARMYAKGCVRHVSQWGGRGDHRILRLEDVWHLAVCNTEIASWSVDGKFD